jgi:CheY-like chemotaxis protein
MHPPKRGHGTEKPAGSTSGKEAAADFSKVLVIGNSPINRVVVSKIVERCGLKPVSGPPETASQAIRMLAPGIVIIDGDNHDGLFDALQTARRAAADVAPRIILLSGPADRQAHPVTRDIVDAVVEKPIIPERLQPIIDSLVTRSRA